MVPILNTLGSLYSHYLDSRYNNGINAMSVFFEMIFACVLARGVAAAPTVSSQCLRARKLELMVALKLTEIDSGSCSRL